MNGDISSIWVLYSKHGVHLGCRDIHQLHQTALLRFQHHERFPLVRQGQGGTNGYFEDVVAQGADGQLHAQCVVGRLDLLEENSRQRGLLQRCPLQLHSITDAFDYTEGMVNINQERNHMPQFDSLTLDQLISALQALKDTGVPGDSSVYLPCRDNNGNGGYLQRIEGVSLCAAAKPEVDKGWSMVKTVATRGVRVPCIH